MRFSASRIDNTVVLTDKERSRLHDKIQYDDCWIWTGYLRPDGYAEAWFRGGPALVIHIVYAAFHGPLGPGLVPDHTCRTRACVNPLHLDGVTHQENVLRGAGIAAQNAVKTTCKRGHAFTPENTYEQHGGAGRGCRTCRTLRSVGAL